LELEIGYVPLVLEGARNPHIQKDQPGFLDASQEIMPLEIPDHVDRSMGDIHPGGNPHYTLDPLNMKIVASHIAQRLSELSPDHTAAFQANLEAFNSRIDQKMQEWQSSLSSYKGEKLITYHKIWPYFARRFGFKIASELEPKPGIPPTPSHLKEVIDLVKRHNIKVILNENIHKDDAAYFVAQATGVRVVVAPVSVGGTKEAKDYFSLIDNIVDQLAEGFKS
jgi:ABC-type Zn uptake system ZnuABC Zn-binding protein ZnuA